MQDGDGGKSRSRARVQAINTKMGFDIKSLDFIFGAIERLCRQAAPTFTAVHMLIAFNQSRPSAHVQLCVSEGL